MRATNNGRPRRRGLRPSLERVEARELPSGILAILPSLLGHLPTTHSISATAAGTVGQPTPHELAREAFSARFKGHYTVGPGRLTTDAQRIFFIGGGTSNTFLHGNMLMALTTPVNPSDPIAGTASFIVKNFSNTGNQLGLDLVGDPASLVHGLPTRFTWTVNGNSGGTFLGSTGQGTGQIIYMPGGRLPQRATGAGTFGVVFQGLVNTTGVNDALHF